MYILLVKLYLIIYIYASTLLTCANYQDMKLNEPQKPHSTWYT